MKKSLVCVLMMLFTLNLFASCNKDGIVKTWSLGKIKTEDVPGGRPKFVSGPLFMNWEAEQGTALGFLQVKGLPGMVMPMGGNLLEKSLKDITFEKNGNIVITYAAPSQDTSKQAPINWQKSEPGFATYTIKDKRLHIFPNLEKIMALVPADSLKNNVDLSGALDILTKGIPVNYTITDNKANLFIDKAFIEKITPLIMAYAGKIDNTAMGNMGALIKSMLQNFPIALQKTTKLEIGLNLE